MIYVYRCPGGHITEHDCPMGEQPATVECSICQGEARRVYTTPPIHYRGTGWTGAGHGIPDLNEREELPGPLEFDDKYEEMGLDPV